MIIAGPENVERIGLGLDHAESLCIGPDRMIYAGGEKGQVYRFAHGSAPEQYASTGGDILGVALDGDGNLYVCDCANAAVLRVDPSGTVATYSNGIFERPMVFPNAPAFDSAGNLFVSDSGDYWDPNGNGCIFRVAADGRTELFHSGPFRYPNGIAIDNSEQWLYIAQSPTWNVVRIRLDVPDGPIEPVFQLPDHTIVDGMIFGAGDVLVIGCYKPDCVVACYPDGRMETVIDDPTAELLLRPTNVWLADDRLYISNLGGRHISVVETDLRPGPVRRPMLSGEQLAAQ